MLPLKAQPLLHLSEQPFLASVCHEHSVPLPSRNTETCISRLSERDAMLQGRGESLPACLDGKKPHSTEVSHSIYWSGAL